MTSRAYDIGMLAGTACTTAGVWRLWGGDVALLALGALLIVLTIVAALLIRVKG